MSSSTEKPNKGLPSGKVPSPGSSKLAAPSASMDEDLPPLVPVGDLAVEGTTFEGNSPSQGTAKSKNAKTDAGNGTTTAGHSQEASKESSKRESKGTAKEETKGAGKRKASAKGSTGAHKKAVTGASSALHSDTSSDEEDESNNADVFSTKDVDSDDEATGELIRRAKNKANETAKTVRYINAFLDASKDKHFVEVPITPLHGKSNWKTWTREIELVFRIHQVWPLCEGTIFPLEEDHEMFIWYERMVDIALACIYKNVSPSVREIPCFVTFFHRREPDNLMSHLFTHYGDHDDSNSHGDSDSDSDGSF